MTRSLRNIFRILLAIALLAVTAAGCASGADDVDDNVAGAGEVAEKPDWVTSVYPAPGAETTATRAVQVRYETLPAGNEIRLMIDDVDVTAYAQQGTGLLEYDIDQANAPVELEPGTHEATLQLYSGEEGASEGVENYDPSERMVIDTYSWEFELS